MAKIPSTNHLTPDRLRALSVPGVDRDAHGVLHLSPSERDARRPEREASW